MRAAWRQSAVTAWCSRAVALMEVASLVRRWASSPSSASHPVGGSTSAPPWPSSTASVVAVTVGMPASFTASSAANCWARVASAARRPRNHVTPAARDYTACRLMAEVWAARHPVLLLGVTVLEG
ncbi:hypothetical protein [Nonomuraea africana]|uniref:Secreted protein n=1 Tax=Nonomuraea africana TaxID=46171 RepID=A0ABR9KD24_9ACTN|nr:hypothetical protein [Nonomuraea africana]MBE1559618.1 hypothetical protein [Nonomuraea africana]